MLLLAFLSTVLLVVPGGSSQHGWVSTTSDAHLYPTTYSVACPPPGIVVAPLYIEVANQMLQYDQIVTQCDGGVWYGIPEPQGSAESSDWWLPARMVTAVYPSPRPCSGLWTGGPCTSGSGSGRSLGAGAPLRVARLQ